MSDQVQGVGYSESEVEIDVVALELETSVGAPKLEMNAAALELEIDTTALDLEMKTNMLRKYRSRRGIQLTRSGRC
jgi:hypothetical protein